MRRRGGRKPDRQAIAARYFDSALSRVSVVADDLVLRIKHPKGLYRARIQNTPRPVYTPPFLLSLHLHFDAPTFDETPQQLPAQNHPRASKTAK